MKYGVPNSFPLFVTSCSVDSNPIVPPDVFFFVHTPAHVPHEHSHYTVTFFIASLSSVTPPLFPQATGKAATSLVTPFPKFPLQRLPRIGESNPNQCVLLFSGFSWEKSLLR